MSVEILSASERLQAEAFLRERGERWGSGITLAFRSRGALAGLARLEEPNPGDGHHREHVRKLVASGEEASFRALVAAALEVAGEDRRVEAECTDARPAWREALVEAGVAEEVALPSGWREEGRDLTWRLHGRPARRAKGGEPKVVAPPRGEGVADVRLEWSDEATRAALGRFLAALVPGRAYPPGTLLSEAERLETERPRRSVGAWLLALRPDGEVAGALSLERPAEPQRAHVRRIHLDVLRAHRGTGLATALVARAIADARRLGIERLEADPRVGNAGAVLALERGGLALEGTQVRAWRLRGPAGAWDEDVAWYGAAP